MIEQTGAKKEVVVAFGGVGPEREVSLASGTAVLEGFRSRNRKARGVDVRSLRDAWELVASARSCVVFVALHGAWGEDGRFQALLEMGEVPYTGTGPGGCALAMDKVASKAIFQEQGIPVAWSRGVLEGENPWSVPEVRQRVEAGRRLVVKPARCGSTVGISVVTDRKELEEGVTYARNFDKKILVEDFVPGREITVAVWEGERGPETLPPVEIQPREGFYSYAAKYTAGASTYLVPAPLSAAEDERVRRAAIGAHRAVGCAVYSRVDLRLTASGEPRVLEVNTAPGMTATSLVPKAAAARGWSFGELVERIVDRSLACRR